MEEAHGVIIVGRLTQSRTVHNLTFPLLIRPVGTDGRHSLIFSVARRINLAPNTARSGLDYD